MNDHTLSTIARVTGWAAVVAHFSILAGVITLMTTGGFGA